MVEESIIPLGVGVILASSHRPHSNLFSIMIVKAIDGEEKGGYGRVKGMAVQQEYIANFKFMIFVKTK